MTVRSGVFGARPRHRQLAGVAVLLTVGLLAAGCTSGDSSAPVSSFGKASSTSATRSGTGSSTPTGGTKPGTPSTGTSGGPASPTIPGMPPVLNPSDAYSADRPGMLSPAVAGIAPMVYVPNTLSNTVSVIDPRTFNVVRTVPVGRQPQHVVPSWDLKTLWVNNDVGNSLTPIDPRTGVFGTPIPVADPYNLYFTPDGKYAVVMASKLRRLDFRDPHTMALRKSVPVNCQGVNHADWSIDGRYFIVSCEFSGQLLKVDTVKMAVLSELTLPGGGMPQDVKMAPNGREFYIADMMRDGVWVLDGDTFRIKRLVPTGKGAHGIYVDRSSTKMYVSNRGEGTITVWDFRTDRPAKKFVIPGGGSPDMGGLSADGTQFWVSGRYNGVVYVISTVTGALLAKIAVQGGPHGLAYFPQPGRYSLGHTGVYR